MLPFPVVTSSCDNTTFSGTSAQSGATLAPAARYFVVADQACYISQGANPTASAADGNMFLPANCPVVLAGSNGAKVAVIQSTTGGTLSITRIMD